MDVLRRKKSMRAANGSDPRRTSRRFFGRTSSNMLRSSKSMPPEEQLPRRRSFLAKPPAPGAARRVLAVLNQSQKRAPSATRKPPTNRRPSSAQAPVVSATGYEELDDKPIRVQSRRSHHNSPTAPSSNRTSSSPLKKPVAPPRKVRPLEDVSDPVRSEPAASSMPPPPPSSRGHLQQVLMDVEASEVSDDIQSSTDTKSRSDRFSSSTTRSPERDSPSRTQDVVLIDETPSPGVKFANVASDEAYIPSAPTDADTQFPNKLGPVQSWASFEGRIRALQCGVDEARDGLRAAHRANEDLRLRNRELEVLVESFRTRTAQSSAEVEELTRHLKETRKRLTRRIRELEDELASQKSRHAEEVAKYRDLENQFRTGANSPQGANGEVPSASSVPSLPARKSRAKSSTSPSPMKNDVSTRTLADGATVHAVQNLHFGRVRSTGSVHEHAKRRNIRSESFSSMQRSGTPNRKPCYVGVDEEDCSHLILARRSLIRRALIAHIHSSRYRSAKNVWYDFLEAEAGNVTPDQFARAVRGLAVAADAHDHDLDLLRQEVCGAEECDTGVLSWAMFLRFYQATKNEST